MMRREWIRGGMLKSYISEWDTIEDIVNAAGDDR
jgi:hypothetical protein